MVFEFIFICKFFAEVCILATLMNLLLIDPLEAMKLDDVLVCDPVGLPTRSSTESSKEFPKFQQRQGHFPHPNFSNSHRIPHQTLTQPSIHFSICILFNVREGTWQRAQGTRQSLRDQVLF